ncbi:MAG: acyl-CoA dehydrogenase family protein, partial [Gammaproteobacteria bacterium]
MDFGFTEEQSLLRDQVRRFLDDRAALTEVREWIKSPEGFSPALWREMAELGWVGLTVPEAYG